MKKMLFFAAIALTALGSCTSDEFVGENNPNVGQDNGAIVFGTGINAITRAEKTGAEAAAELNSAFVVEGTKGDNSVATTVVFDNYNVQYTANTANTTESNTNNWEYVGLDVNSLASIYHSGDKQTIKYWDYSKAQYDFIAYSLGNGGATATRITPETATSSTGGAYTIAGTASQLGTVHIADLVTVAKANYSNVVEIKFRSLASKIRIALYETIPGYSVRNVKFYTSDAAISGGSNSTTAALYTSGSSTLPASGTYTVYFKTVNDATPTTDKNKAHVVFSAAATDGTATSMSFGTLATNKLVKREKYEYTTDDTKDLLGRTSDAATYAGATDNNYYTKVLPNESGAALTLKVDYELISTDGTGETIKVVGAKAVVPAIYAQWQPGYAYTYIFKISDNNNGYTSGVESSETQGLHAITFDAVAIETQDGVQETVTTVATPSITTYQHDPATNASSNNEYVAGTVYAMVMDGGTLKTDLNTKSNFYSLNREATEAEVMEALNMNDQSSETFTSSITGRNGLVLTTATIDNTITTIPGADGNDINLESAGKASKLTVAAGTTYAYVYTATAPSTPTHVDRYELVPNVVANQTTVTGYYTYNESASPQYALISTENTTAEANTNYYAKVDYYTNTGVFAVKVIKVAGSSSGGSGSGN